MQIAFYVIGWRELSGTAKKIRDQIAENNFPTHRTWVDIEHPTNAFPKLIQGYYFSSAKQNKFENVSSKPDRQADSVPR